MKTVEQNESDPVQFKRAVRWVLADYGGPDLWKKGELVRVMRFDHIARDVLAPLPNLPARTKLPKTWFKIPRSKLHQNGQL